MRAIATAAPGPGARALRGLERGDDRRLVAAQPIERVGDGVGAALAEQHRLEAEAAHEVAEVAAVGADDEPAVVQQRIERARLRRLAIRQDEDDVAGEQRQQLGRIEVAVVDDDAERDELVAQRPERRVPGAVDFEAQAHRLDPLRARQLGEQLDPLVRLDGAPVDERLGRARGDVGHRRETGLDRRGAVADHLRTGTKALAVAGEEVVAAEAADEDELSCQRGEPRRRCMAPPREAVRHRVVDGEKELSPQRPEERDFERPEGAELEIDDVVVAAPAPEIDQQRQVRKGAAPARRDGARDRAIANRDAGKRAQGRQELAVVARARGEDVDPDPSGRERGHQLVVVRQDERPAVDERHLHCSRARAPFNARTSSAGRAGTRARLRAGRGHAPDCRRRCDTARRPW